MPTHDRAADLERAAASVLDQDVEPLELVVVDDASTDATLEVLDRLARRDKRVRVVRTERALGPCEARNRGLAVAGGELVGFCDDDDAWFPGVGRAVTEFLAARPEVVAASAWHVVSHRAEGATAVFRGPLRYDSSQLLWQNVIAVPFAVVRRAALSFEVGFDPELPTGEDWDLFLRCSFEGPVRTVPTVGYLYTQHGGSRVTRTGDAQTVGRRNFLRKHGHAMTGRCRLYHETVLAGYAGGRRAMGDRLRQPGTPRRDALAVTTVLGASAAAARLGQRRGDPGLQARLMTRLVGSRSGRGRAPRRARARSGAPAVGR